MMESIDRVTLGAQSLEDSSVSFDKPQYVQAHINNCKCIPETVDELLTYIEDYPVREIETLLFDDHTCWAVPKWSKRGDIIFFMIQKETPNKMRRLRRELVARKNEFEAGRYSFLSAYVEELDTLINKYHGKIISVGRVDGTPFYETEFKTTRWQTRIYVDVYPLKSLEKPIDISEFNGFIRVSRQSAITGVFGEEFDRLKDLICRKNAGLDFLKISYASPLPYNRINKDNWLEIANDFRRSFLLEAQFRAYYVDFLLAAIKDRGTKIYAESTCQKAGKPDTYIDNVISFNHKYLMVEDKLDIQAERDIKGQVQQYCRVDNCILDSKMSKQAAGTDFYQDKVLIIDTEKIYLYDALTDVVRELFDLDRLHSRKDIAKVKEIIRDMLKIPEQI